MIRREHFWLPVPPKDLLHLAAWLPVPFLGQVRRTPEQAMAVLDERSRAVRAAAKATFRDAIREAKYRRLSAVSA